MRVLFDQGVPVPLRASVPAAVDTCFEMGWSSLTNGALLAKAEGAFHTFVTTDKNLRYQQPLSTRKIAIFVLPTTRWPRLRPHAEAIGKALVMLEPGDYLEWRFPEVS